ncbi:nitrogen regulation protein NR(II) [Maridesulfovibrio ferrireducens]|uniref:two-component system sensor histidine kinase NtrB n=1 Tax=Maridesulfovibrio ferrireducens TaxID=246191 RepID=UPI001A243358|nr:ATP-binding protein [Maridesulfovibrio ferrireducens]MBI9111475.1 PAS domain S-box protein [Maridesulfovibrio ferrireducens]
MKYFINPYRSLNCPFKNLLPIVLILFLTFISVCSFPYEVFAKDKFITPDLITIDHINHTIWQHIADNLFFDPSVDHYELKKETIIYIGLLFASVVLVLLFMMLFARKLKKEVDTRKEIEAKLIKSEQYYRSLFHNTGTATVILGEDLYIKKCNSNFADLCGLKNDEIENKKKWTDFVTIDELAKMHKYHLARKDNESTAPRAYEFKFLRANGEIRNVSVYVEKISGSTDRVASLIDLTEKIKTQDLLIQTEKMISVGGLAAGMAHEINNPLAGILQGTQNILRRLSPDYKKNIITTKEGKCSFEEMISFLNERGILRMIEGIQISGERAAEIVKNMLEFSRRSDAGRTSCNLNKLLDGIIDIVSCDYDLRKKYDFKHTQIVKEYADNSYMISCFKTEIEQVLLNLIKNAAFAMAETAQKRTPKLTLRTRYKKDFIIIEVKDNGSGMPEDIRRRVFEPFFTTKAPGVGTGLGLSVSYFIITQNHKGIFEVESTVDKGTKFSIKIPSI